MLDSKIRAGWDRLMRPIGAALGRALTANTVTTLGLLIQVGVAVFILQGRLLMAGLIAVVAALCDAFDGAIAKARGSTSSFGAFYDSTTDRLSDALFFIPIAWLYGIAPDVPSRRSTVVAGLALATLVASFLVSYVRARAESLGFDAKVGLAERAERLILVIAGLILNLLLYALAILSVLSIVTFVQRVVHVRRQARA